MTIYRAIKKLLELDLIRRVGSNKTGYWEVKKVLIHNGTDVCGKTNSSTKLY